MITVSVFTNDGNTVQQKTGKLGCGSLYTTSAGVEIAANPDPECDSLCKLPSSRDAKTTGFFRRRQVSLEDARFFDGASPSSRLAIAGNIFPRTRGRNVVQKVVTWSQREPRSGTAHLKEIAGTNSTTIFGHHRFHGVEMSREPSSLRIVQHRGRCCNCRFHCRW